MRYRYLFSILTFFFDKKRVMPAHDASAPCTNSFLIIKKTVCYVRNKTALVVLHEIKNHGCYASSPKFLFYYIQRL
jgi:hypothetical protein